MKSRHYKHGAKYRSRCNCPICWRQKHAKIKYLGRDRLYIKNDTKREIKE